MSNEALRTDVLMRLQHLSQQINELIQQEQYRSSPSMSIPLRPMSYTMIGHPERARPAAAARPAVARQGLNPEAKEFVPQQRMNQAPPQVRFSDILQEGESVYLTVVIGHYEDGYPILTACVALYDGKTFTVNACEEVPQMVGKSSEKPGTLLYEFIRGLKQARKLRHEPKGSVWRHCHVKRDGKHISFTRLAQAFLSSQS